MLLESRTAAILHLDVDAFFASVEQRDEPRLDGRPVAVGTGVVASCSYESRLWGVRTGMRLSEARQRCPTLVVLPGDYRRYEQAGRCIQAICLEHTPLVEPLALDDLYLDLGQPGRPAAEQEEICRRTADTLAEQIQDEVGLSVSIGMATNKMVASVATDDAKRRRLQHWQDQGAAPPIPRSTPLLIPAGTEAAYLAPWPIEVLPGVGPKVQAQLERLNVQRVGELAEVPLAVLCGLFGTRGRALRLLARGIDRRPIDPERPARSVSRRTSFDPPTGDRDFLQAMLHHLLERAIGWLRCQGLGTRGLTLTLCYGNYRTVEGRVSFAESTCAEDILQQAARDRLQRLHSRRLPLRLLGVQLAPLQPPRHQGQLFPDPDVERVGRLAQCKETVRQRFGFMALLNGSALLLADRLDQDRENFRLRTPCLTR